MDERIRSLMEANGFCVLATVSGKTPHCSLMSYAVDEGFRKIYLVMNKSTKKFENLTENPAVSLLIDSRATDRGGHARALTVTGTAYVAAGEEESLIRTCLLERHPHLSEIVDDEGVEFVVVGIRAFQLLDGIKDAYYETVD